MTWRVDGCPQCQQEFAWSRHKTRGKDDNSGGDRTQSHAMLIKKVSSSSIVQVQTIDNRPNGKNYLQKKPMTIENCLRNHLPGRIFLPLPHCQLPVLLTPWNIWYKTLQQVRCHLRRAMVSIWFEGSEPVVRRHIRGTLLSVSSSIASKSSTVFSRNSAPKESKMYFLAWERVRSGHHERMRRSLRKTSREDW